MTKAILTHGDSARCPDVQSGRHPRCMGHEVDDRRAVDLAVARRLALATMNLEVAADLLDGAGVADLAAEARDLRRRARGLYREERP